MRVLISAYACEPDRGSEPEVGLQAVLSAASRHDVWVITRENNLPPLRAFLEHHPLRSRVHALGLDVEGLALRAKKRAGLVGVHWYYDLWQRRLSDMAVRLDREVDFDVVHHATFAAYWLRAGVAEVDKPLVWGPVGGGVRPPLGLLPVMGLRGAALDAVRVLVRPAVSRVTRARRTARQAEVVLVQNPDTARRLGLKDTAVLLPNALVAEQLIPRGRVGGGASNPKIVTAGRLIGLKGTALAIAALGYLRDPTATLDVYGAGPEEKRLHGLAHRLGMAERVRFLGAVPRGDLLAAIEEASVLVQPSLHDEAPLAVAEALALGTPVVGLDHGGPPVIARFFPSVPCRMVKPTTPHRTARRIAAAIEDLIGQRGTGQAPRDRLFSEALLAAYEKAVGRMARG